MNSNNDIILSSNKENTETGNSSRRDFLKKTTAGVVAIGALAASGTSAFAAEKTKASDFPTPPPGADNFYQSDKVDIEKVSFSDQYTMRIVGNLITPKNLNRSGQAPAIIVGHPMGAIKEQSAMLYAQKMAEQGFVTLAIDLPFWGESAGEPRNLVAPERYAEAFSAAVDYLGSQDFINPKRIGVIGICGSGGFSVSAAKMDPRLQAVATVSMYDMGSVTRNGLNHSVTVDQRKAMLAKGTEQRYTESATGKGIFMNFLPVKPNSDTDAITREFWDFYRTPRGWAIPKGQTLNETENRTLASEIRFVNFYPFNDIETISPRPMLFITGDKAHSREFSEDAFKRAAEPKELYYVAGAGHVDLYDRVNLIPWTKLTSFFRQHLVA